MKTIPEVIIALTQIIDTAQKEKSAIGYFACLYRKMTIAVQQGIQNNQFEDGKRMEQLDILFASRYLEAYALMRAGKMPSQAWNLAFEATKKNNATVLQYLLMGINAHINLDLGIAAAQTCSNDAIHGLKNDFDKINQVIANIVGEVQSELAQIWFPLKFINKIAYKSEDAVINFSIGIARKSAWKVATDLAPIPANSQSNYINQLDKRITFLGKTIESPGMKDTIMCKMIKLFELSDVEKVIEILK